jgi:hypothetical protein
MRLVFSLALGAVILFTLLCDAPAQAQTPATRSVWYGPFTIPAATDAGPGETGNQFRFAVRRPCSDCYITSFTPDLVYSDGSSATMETGPMLHHAVFASLFKPDATCSGTLLGLAGERFFASGDERTAIALPTGFGYRVNWWDSWSLLVDLMNHSRAEKTVYLEVTYSTRPSSDSINPVRPVWLDIDQCGDSEYSIPSGFSDTHWDWSVNVPGKVVFMAGHVHGHGIAVEATNESRGGRSICRSVATPDPLDLHRVLDMSTCSGNLGVIRQGETVRLHSEYNSSHAANDVMGIMLAYIDFD